MIWLGITAVLICADDIPIVFPAAFGFFAVLLVWGALREWLAGELERALRGESVERRRASA